MTAYIIARVRVTDVEAYKPYQTQVPGLIAQFGGHYLVRGGTIETLEGPTEERRVVVIGFDDMDAARRFYHSAEYRAIVPLRQAASEGQLILVDGYDG